MNLGPLSDDDWVAPTKPIIRSTWLTMGDLEYDQLNPPICSVIFRYDGIYVRQIDDARWLPVGYIPAPRTRLGWFVYHVIHGIAMRYRFLPVLVYSFREAFLND